MTILVPEAPTGPTLFDDPLAADTCGKHASDWFRGQIRLTRGNMGKLRKIPAFRDLLEILEIGGKITGSATLTLKANRTYTVVKGRKHSMRSIHANLEIRAKVVGKKEKV